MEQFNCNFVNFVKNLLIHTITFIFKKTSVKFKQATDETNKIYP